MYCILKKLTIYALLRGGRQRQTDSHSDMYIVYVHYTYRQKQTYYRQMNRV